MSTALIEKLRKSRDDYKRTAETLLERQTDDEHPLADADKANLDSAMGEVKALDARITELTTWETDRLQAANRDARFDALRIESGDGMQSGGRVEKVTSWVETFIQSSEFQAFAEQGRNGVTNVTLDPITALSEGDDGGSVGGRTLISGADALAGVHRARQREGGTFPTPLLDAAGYEPVSSTSFDYISWPNTPPQPAAVTAEGAAKPEATYTPVPLNGKLGKLAQTIPLTSEILQDIPRVQAIVSGALVRGLRLKGEATAGAALAAAVGTGTAEDANSLLNAIRVGIATTQVAGWPVTGVALNPLDYATIDIDLLASTLMGARRDSPIWGATPIPAPALAAGTAYVGDFGEGLTVFARSDVELRMTDSHAAEFVSNIYRILAEWRMTVMVTRPEALTKCTSP